jgi:hypothetical protein
MAGNHRQQQMLGGIGADAVAGGNLSQSALAFVGQLSHLRLLFFQA